MFALLLSLGCPWLDESDHQSVVDGDGDGLAAPRFGGDDCDDADPEVGRPGTSTYADADGDGFGDAAAPSIRCGTGAGAVADNTDCDDGDATVGGPVERWPDSDADGYARDDAEAELSCPASGLVTQRGDCNDDDATIHPGVVESCLGDVDANCDGSLGGDLCTTAGLGPVMTGDVGGIGSQTDFAFNTLGRVDVDGDGVLDVVVSAPYGYELFAFSGVDLLAGADLDEADAAMHFDEYHFLMGEGLAVGDATGDGVDDLLVGCPGSNEDPEGDAAELVVVALPASGYIGRSDGIVSGEDRGGWFGFSAAWNSDFGGAPAVLVGAPVENTYEGGAWVFGMPLPDDGTHVVTELNPAITRGFPSEGDGYGLGWDVAWLDAEGGDIAVVADQAGIFDGQISGVVAMWRPELGATTLVSESAGSGIHGLSGYEGFGYSISVGDYNGDEVEDLAVGAMHGEGQASGTGVVYVYESAAALEGWHDERDFDFEFRGEDRNDPRASTPPLLGVKVAFAGDMNGDGHVDLAMGAPFAKGLGDQPGAGAVYVAPGGLAEASYDVQDACWSRYGDRADLHAGYGLAPAGDIDADGRDELIVGMPGWTDDVGTQVGAVTVWWGSQL